MWSINLRILNLNFRWSKVRSSALEWLWLRMLSWKTTSAQFKTDKACSTWVKLSIMRSCHFCSWLQKKSEQQRMDFWTAMISLCDSKETRIQGVIMQKREQFTTLPEERERSIIAQTTRAIALCLVASHLSPAMELISKSSCLSLKLLRCTLTMEHLSMSKRVPP